MALCILWLMRCCLDCDTHKFNYNGIRFALAVCVCVACMQTCMSGMCVRTHMHDCVSVCTRAHRCTHVLMYVHLCAQVSLVWLCDTEVCEVCAKNEQRNYRFHNNE